MPQMTDQEFIAFYKDFYGVLDLSDDEFIERRRQIEDGFEFGWDMKKYLAYWQDPNRTPNLVSKSALAQRLDVSLKTVDDWVRRGAPVYRKGDHGVAYEIDTGAFFEWQIARTAGISIEEYRRTELEAENRRRERDAARWRLIEAEYKNRKLAATMETLTAELAALRREVQSIERPPKNN
jgi:hypothetical protein